jgi:hypothetical protein
VTGRPYPIMSRVSLSVHPQLPVVTSPMVSVAFG